MCNAWMCECVNILMCASVNVYMCECVTRETRLCNNNNMSTIDDVNAWLSYIEIQIGIEILLELMWHEARSYSVTYGKIVVPWNKLLEVFALNHICASESKYCVAKKVLAFEFKSKSWFVFLVFHWSTLLYI